MTRARGSLMRSKLTPAFVAKPPLPEKGDRVIYWDSTQSGFGLMVTKAGHKYMSASTAPAGCRVECLSSPD
jgi:hypothetical protein